MGRLHRLIGGIFASLGFGGESPRSSLGPAGIHVLAVTLSLRDRQVLQDAAKRKSWNLNLCGSCDEALVSLRWKRCEVILLDRDVCGVEWRRTLSTLVASAPHASIILASAVNDEYLWREVIQLQGYDVLTKPLQEEKLSHCVEMAWSFWRRASSGGPAIPRPVHGKPHI